MDDLVDLVKRIKDNTSSALKVALPGVIQSYDYKKQKASVKIDIKEPLSDGSSIDYPIVNGVPVIFPASGGAALTMPVNAGDGCLLVFADRDISGWLIGGSGLKPDNLRTHNLSDAVAIMGLTQFSKQGKALNNKDVQLTFSGSNITLKPNGILEITSANQINVKTKDITINCNNSTVNVTESVTLNCNHADITVTEDAHLTCNHLDITAAEAIHLTCADTTLTVSGDIDVTCANANITASGNITTKATTLDHTGDMKVSGTLELGGNLSGSAGGTLNVAAGIINNAGTIVTSGKTIDTHSHSYFKTSESTVPATTGSM